MPQEPRLRPSHRVSFHCERQFRCGFRGSQSVATVSLSPEKIITRLVLVFILISKACGRELKYLITINISLHDRMEDIVPLVTEWVYCYSSTRVRGRWRPHHRAWDSGKAWMKGRKKRGARAMRMKLQGNVGHDLCSCHRN